MKSKTTGGCIIHYAENYMGTQISVTSQAGTVLCQVRDADGRIRESDIFGLWVNPAQRRLGVGKALLETIEQEAIAFGVDVFIVSVRTKEAEAFFKKHGYEKLAPDEDDVVMMRKKITRDTTAKDPKPPFVLRSISICSDYDRCMLRSEGIEPSVCEISDIIVREGVGDAKTLMTMADCAARGMGCTIMRYRIPSHEMLWVKDYFYGAYGRDAAIGEVIEKNL